MPYVEALSDQYFPGDPERMKIIRSWFRPAPRPKHFAVGTVLAAFNWPENSDRYKRIARFVEAFFSKFDDFLAPSRHPKWSEVNLAADVPGWKRFPAAQPWLDSRVDEPTATGSITGVQQGSVNRVRKRADIKNQTSEQLPRDRPGLISGRGLPVPPRRPPHCQQTRAVCWRE